MDNLPDEWFTQILDLVPIRDIFVLMRVSKRWAAACRFVVRTRQSLVIRNYGLFGWLHNVFCIKNFIGDHSWYRSYVDAGKMRGWDWHRHRPSEPLDSVIFAKGSLESDMMKRLNQIENITRLCVCDTSLKGIRPFVQKFAHQLTMLEVPFAISDVGSDVFPHLTQLHCRNFNAETAAAFPKLTELVLPYPDVLQKQPDMRLPSLKRLIYIHPSDEQIKEFVQQNAGNLEFLSVYKFKFDRSVVFQNLTQVSCGGMDVVMVKSLPSIRRLNVKGSITLDFLKSLPAAQMLSLDIRLLLSFPEHDNHNDEELVECAAVISGMHSLEELSIDAQLNPLIRKTMDLSPSLSSMFQKLHHLEKVSIRIDGNHSRKSGNNIMSALVQQNTKLHDVCFSGFNFTSAAYASLAQLQHLSHFSLRGLNSFTSPNRITTNDVLTLLRGSSRKVIRKLGVWKKFADVDRVTCEIKLMAQERGTTFEKSEGHYSFEYNIHA